jgi:ABC-type transport system involved in multi-copper enzyme maturation permease subunit
MMRKLYSLFKVSFLELYRERILWVGTAACVVLFLASLLLGALSFDERNRILFHFGFLAIHLSGIFFAVAIGSQMIHREINRQTCLLVLSRPVGRGLFLVSKGLVLFVAWLLQAVVLFVLMSLLLSEFFQAGPFLTVFWGTSLEVAIVMSLAFFFSTFTSSFVAGTLSFSVFLIGHGVQSVTHFAEKIKDEGLLFAVRISEWLFPQLHLLNFRSVYFVEDPVSSGTLVWASLHSFGWILLVWSLAIFIFRRRDLV